MNAIRNTHANPIRPVFRPPTTVRIKKAIPNFTNKKLTIFLSSTVVRFLYFSESPETAGHFGDTGCGNKNFISFARYPEMLAQQYSKYYYRAQI